MRGKQVEVQGRAQERLLLLVAGIVSVALAAPCFRPATAE